MSLAIIGHSFVRRIADHELLAFKHEDLHVGLGGATVKTLAESYELIQLMLCRPKRIFIQIGGNDIKKDTTSDQIFKDITEFVDHLKECGVTQIIVGSLFPRFQPRRMTYHQYESQRKEINLKLSGKYAKSTVITFWKRRGLVNPPRSAFTDGVHLTKKFEHIYARQIKLALFCNTFK